MSLYELGRRPDWMVRGACLGLPPEMRDQVFFPERGESCRPARRICAGCPVIDECLDYALVNGERFGVWGGLSERERRRLRRSRGLAGPPLPHQQEAS